MIKTTISSPSDCITPKVPSLPPQATVLTVQSTNLDGNASKQIVSKIMSQEPFCHVPYSQRLSILDQELRNIFKR